MKPRYAARIKGTAHILRMELQCHLACLYGHMKVRFFFKRDQVNKLEFGVGDSPRKPGFITSDLSIRTDYPFDLRAGLPFPDESLDFIYSEHVLEHFGYPDFVMLLRECHRTLKPAGTLSLAVPDPTPFIEAYSRPDEFDRKKYCDYDVGLTFGSKIDYLNYIFYMGNGHLYMNDRDSILRHLSDAGFLDPRIRSFDPELDQKSREDTSLYAIATK